MYFISFLYYVLFLLKVVDIVKNCKYYNNLRTDVMKEEAKPFWIYATVSLVFHALTYFVWGITFSPGVYDVIKQYFLIVLLLVIALYVLALCFSNKARKYATRRIDILLTNLAEQYDEIARKQEDNNIAAENEI